MADETQNETHPWHGDVAEQDDELIEGLLHEARRMMAEKRMLQARMGANRDILRIMREQGAASQRQADDVESYYPTKMTARQVELAAARRAEMDDAETEWDGVDRRKEDVPVEHDRRSASSEGDETADAPAPRRSRRKAS